MATNGHIAKFVALPGRRADLIAALRPMFEEVESEPGTLLYMMHTVPSEPDTLWFYERYRDAAAFEVHRTSRAHDAVIEAVRPLVTTWPPEIHHLELLASKPNAVLP
jgi:quinol monooxygenase YgiN